MKKLNIVFAGTPEFAAKHLEALISSEHNIIGVYTQPDRPAGRGKKLQPSAVKLVAQQHDIAVYQPKSLRDEDALQELASLKPDLMIVVAYGLILPKQALDTPKFGCINVHGSILPKWRGAAPIQRSLWAGDTETGVTVMQMDIGLDTGDMLHIETCPISDTDTSESLYQKLAELGPSALLTTVAQISNGEHTPLKQDDSLATYAEKLSKEEAKLDWSKSAVALHREIRAFNPWPISHFNIDGITIKAHKANVDATAHSAPVGSILSADKHGLKIACGEGAIVLTELQLPNKRKMATADALNNREALFAVGKIVGDNLE